MMSKSNYEKYAEVKQQELLHKERNLQQAISCLNYSIKKLTICKVTIYEYINDLHCYMYKKNPFQYI